MAFFYLAPRWFFGYDIALELLFGIVTAFVAFFSFKIFKLSEQREVKLLGLSFSAISISYFIWPLINLFALSKVNNEVNALTLQNLSILLFAGVYSYVFFFILGLATLAYLTFNVKSQRLYALIVSLSIIVVIFSSQVGLAFNFVSALLLFYVSLYYLNKYITLKDNRIFLVLVAFVLLFFARVVFAFSAVNNLFYVVVHIIEFLAYLLIVISLVRVMKK